MFDLGLVSVSFRKNSPKEILEEIKNADLHFIEWGSDIHAPIDNCERIAELVALQKEYDVKCCSYGTYFRLGESDISLLQSYIDVAKALGTNILRLWCGTKNYEDYGESELSALFYQCKEAEKIARDNNVVLCMECHNKTVTNCLDGILRLMRETNSPYFQMYWQPNQYRSEEVNISCAKEIAKWTKVIHSFNWKGDEKFSLCLATDIWVKYLENFSGEQKLLLEFMPDGNISSLKKEAEALKEIALRVKK